MVPDEGGAIETLQVQPLTARTLEPKEVRALRSKPAGSTSWTCSGRWAWSKRGCSVKNFAAGLSKQVPT